MSEFTQYERDNDVEARFGSPDFDAWALYSDAKKTIPKGSLIVAYHLICAASGLSIDEARDFLNTYTLANYQGNGNKYISDARANKKHYSEHATFGYLYGSEKWQDKTPMSKIQEALITNWAQYVCQKIGIDMQEVQDYIHQLSDEVHIFNGRDVTKPESITPVLCHTQEEISEKVDELLPLVDKGVPLGQKNPEKHNTTSTGYIRDATVAAYVLFHAQGKCESCQQDAPFIRENGKPFLEVHHIKPLADGGSDTITNAIAICPNCHRELHHGVNKQSLKESIYSTNSRLKME